MKILICGHALDAPMSGYGRACYELARALETTGARVDHATNRSSPAEYDVVIVHSTPHTAVSVAGAIRAGGYQGLLIGYTTWEFLDISASMAASFEVFNQVWSPCGRESQLLAQTEARLRVHTVPHAFDVETMKDRVDYTTDKKTDPFRFYWIGAWNARKNPAGLIRAYCHAFSSTNKHVLLRIHSPGVTDLQISHALAQTCLDRSEMPPIKFSREPFIEEEMFQLHKNHDCFVTASRGESWNLPAFDAALAGRHVIAPRVHGSTEFLDGTSADLYESTAQPAYLEDAVMTGADSATTHTMSFSGKAPQGMDCRQTWGDPHLARLSHLMRLAVFGNKRYLAMHQSYAGVPLNKLEPTRDYARSMLVGKFSHANVGRIALDGINYLLQNGSKRA